MASPFPTEMEALAGNCTWHMLAEISESVTRLQERRADLGGTRKGQLKKQHLHCVSKGSDNLPGGKNDRMCLRLGPDKDFFFQVSVCHFQESRGSLYLQYPSGLPGFCLFAFEFCQYLILLFQLSGCLVGFALLYHLLE